MRNGSFITDEEINARLTEVAGFVPSDGWNHVRSALRSGHIYWSKDGEDGSRPDARVVSVQKEFVWPE